MTDNTRGDRESLFIQGNTDNGVGGGGNMGF